jgi:hypothetical protein
MGGHMVSVKHEGNKIVYIANVENREEAIALVERMSGLSNAECLAPVEAATLDQYGVEPGQVRQYLTLDHAGEVVQSRETGATPDRS